ncbi:MAG: hypothetical protein II917_09815 [Synergistaceae bacterium]|nr:hypothetical protein [Synergistaceae bacterium]
MMTRQQKKFRAFLQLIQRIIYYSVLVIIFVMGYRLYRVWYENYKLSHPQFIEAASASYAEEQPLEGILLWDEQLIYAPKSGLLTYPSPRPHIVAKGEALAALDGTEVKAPYPAYFYPGLVGQEGNWVYSRLWPDFAPFPEFHDADLIENGTQIKRGDPIGKLIPQPQILRCIAYLDATPSLVRILGNKDNKYLHIKTEFEGKERKAEVVAVKSQGQKLKVYLRLPFFPPEALRSRKFFAAVICGVQQGVMVPDTAVITREGKNMVFIVKGNSPELKIIEGFPADDNNYFIENGVEPGNKLILNADNIKADNTRIW